MTYPLEPDRLDKLEHILLASPSARVSAEELWRALAQAYPHRAPGPAERQLLSKMLEAIAARGTIKLPPIHGTRWDRSLDPPVPKSVNVVRDRPGQPKFFWRTFPWHSQLSWVSKCRSLSEQQIQFLKKVHDGLVHNAFDEPAPLKYRSLQLTGDEKRLAELVTSSLFGEGRLSLEMLACLPDALPLAWEAVGDGGRMVIFENAGPFAVARRVLAQLMVRPYDMVAYGGGRGIVSAITHITTLERRVTSIHYVGDLDYQGLDIASCAQTRAADLGLPVLQPAAELHCEMLDAAKAFGQPEGWASQKHSSVMGINRVLQFLRTEVRVQVKRILETGRRIPEEVLGPAELRRAWLGQ